MIAALASRLQVQARRRNLPVGGESVSASVLTYLKIFYLGFLYQVAAPHRTAQHLAGVVLPCPTRQAPVPSTACILLFV